MTSYPIPQPFGLSFVDWGSRVAEQLSAFGVGVPWSEDDWKSWVCALFYIPELTARNLPEPGTFTSWQDWAVRFIEAMR